MGAAMPLPLTKKVRTMTDNLKKIKTLGDLANHMDRMTKESFFLQSYLGDVISLLRCDHTSERNIVFAVQRLAEIVEHAKECGYGEKQQ
tara:strand:+ start:496 stop:762 length:267 start_codon:yes stop_codon:yes gene_type:complete